MGLGRSGWLDLAALSAFGRRCCCTWAVFSLISLRRGSVLSRSRWLLRYGHSARSRAPWLPRFGTLGTLLVDLGTLLRISWALLGRSGVPWGRTLAQLGRPGRPATPGWLDLAANECPNDCPIDTISKKKSMCSRTSCLDAACLARSASILHASNLVILYCLFVLRGALP